MTSSSAEYGIAKAEGPAPSEIKDPPAPNFRSRPSTEAIRDRAGHSLPTRLVPAAAAAPIGLVGVKLIRDSKFFYTTFSV